MKLLAFLVVAIVVSTSIFAFQSCTESHEIGQSSDTAMVADPCVDVSLRHPGSVQHTWSWADLCHYEAQNKAVAKSPRVVFIGDSITELWKNSDKTLFSSDVVNRGIGGQTSGQMLLRFYSDVIALNPAMVHILAGTNDIAGNGGTTSETFYENNIKAMAELAHAHGIKVVIGSIPPAAAFKSKPQYRPAAKIRVLNAWLKQYAEQNHFVFVDYYSSLATPEGGMQSALSNDGVHPNKVGYTLMRAIALKALQLEPN